MEPRPEPSKAYMKPSTFMPSTQHPARGVGCRVGCTRWQGGGGPTPSCSLPEQPPTVPESLMSRRVHSTAGFTPPASPATLSGAPCSQAPKFSVCVQHQHRPHWQ